MIRPAFPSLNIMDCAACGERKWEQLPCNACGGTENVPCQPKRGGGGQSAEWMQGWKAFEAGESCWGRGEWRTGWLAAKAHYED